MFTATVLAFFNKGCWYLIEGDKEAALKELRKASHICANNFGSLAMLNYSFPHTNMAEIVALRKTPLLLMKALINLILDKQPIFQEEQAVYNQIVPLIKMLIDLRLAAQNTSSAHKANKNDSSKIFKLLSALENFKLPQDEAIHLSVFKYFCERSAINNLFTALLLKGYLLLNHHYLLLGVRSVPFSAKIANLYLIFAEQNKAIGEHYYAIIGDEQERLSCKKLYGLMLHKSKQAKCIFYQRKCHSILDTIELTQHLDEKAKLFISAIAMLHNAYKSLSIDYLLFIHLLCRLGRYLVFFLDIASQQVDTLSLQQLNPPLQSLIKIFNKISRADLPNIAEKNTSSCALHLQRVRQLMIQYSTDASFLILILTGINVNYAESIKPCDISPIGSDDDQLLPMLNDSLVQELVDDFYVSGGEDCQEQEVNVVSETQISQTDSAALFKHGLFNQNQAGIPGEQLSDGIIKQEGDSEAVEKMGRSSKKQRISFVGH